MNSLNNLNPQQLEAVQTTEGPLLVLAGAGSGKTRVLTQRIAYLIEAGIADPYEILAITFTNKAAKEMRERVLRLVEYGDAVWVATFHSTCVRILKRFADRLGYSTEFTIYDADDQRTAMRHIIKDLELDPKKFKERKLVALISAYKNAHVTVDDLYKEGMNDVAKRTEAEIYEAYEKRLKSNQAMDFDDLLLKTVELFEKNDDVLKLYQRRFRYILVDEYQDTNPVQFRFVYLLAKEHQNIMVVGDDDQSIYRFRGADIRNILDFEKHFPGTQVVKLEQNYRSTTHILDVANAAISRNRGRKDKHLWSALGKGSDVVFRQYDSGKQEAEEIIRKIREKVRNAEYDYSDFAILYRTNNQSRLFEEACINRNVPYTLVGGVNFYQRAEIKDMLAYLKVIAGAVDAQALERALQVPKRGIGDATVVRLQKYADANGLTLFEAVSRADTVPGVERARGKLKEFTDLIMDLRKDAKEESLDDLLRDVYEKTDYASVLDEFEDDKQEQKLENVEELISKAKDFELQWAGEHPPTLGDFLEEVALISDIDTVEDGKNRVLLITVHGAKGLEFPVVFLAGLEEGIFPSYLSVADEDPMALEEERRLFYVGVTRAKKELYLSAAASRLVNGNFQWNEISRFVADIPGALVEKDVVDNGASRRPAERPFGTTAGRSFGTASPYGFSPAPEKPRPPVRETFGRTFTVVKAASLDYKEGDRVRHVKFGEGTVTKIVDGKKDYEVTVNFDSVGERVLMAGFAKLVKI